MNAVRDQKGLAFLYTGCIFKKNYLRHLLILIFEIYFRVNKTYRICKII